MTQERKKEPGAPLAAEGLPIEREADKVARR